jgi:hypothetical protein
MTEETEIDAELANATDARRDDAHLICIGLGEPASLVGGGLLHF